MTSLAQVHTAFALLSLSCLLGCHSSQRVRADAASPAQMGNDETHLSPFMTGNAPDPSPPQLPPKHNEVRKPWIQTQAGLRLCTKERIDLTQVFVKFDISSYTSPEERLLLRYWLDGTFEMAVQQGILTGFHSDHARTEMCSRALFCGWLGADDGAAGAKLLAEFLNAPPLSSFQAARNIALDTADELYERSTTFRFGALVESVAESRAARLGTKLTQANTLDQLLAAPHVAQLSAASLTQTLHRNLSASEVTILAPKDAEPLTQTLLQQLSTGSRPRTTPRADISFDSPLEIVDERFPESTLYLTWPRLEAEQTMGGIALLDRLADEFRVKEPGTYIRVHRGDGLVKRPALVISAAHELLMRSADGLASRAKTLLSAQERDPPDLTQGNDEQNCWSTPHKNSLMSADLGDPLITIWGAKVPPKSEESF